ncbi:SPOR domain-containing protein [Ferruginibacter albus]|uniref:SPOR domain-containing protein n=1 Tax=Ferruginibacter albus TaxID=2875540 RepID=UPI001CC5DA73|nr:SPOR domain-containing protein [Ferruginibacter albus]UAY52801.1 SPOR domain-containing protein [Ferruginibacter albus]
MKKIVLIAITSFVYTSLLAQDSAAAKNVFVTKDSRLDILAKKEAEFNEADGALTGKYTKGYRLLVLNTTDRAQALKIRAQLLQSFPDEKIYMTFQAPNIKLKFGDFLDKDEAEKYKSELEDSKIITGNIYVVSELVENKPSKETTTQ